MTSIRPLVFLFVTLATVYTVVTMNVFAMDADAGPSDSRGEQINRLVSDIKFYFDNFEAFPNTFRHIDVQVGEPYDIHFQRNHMLARAEDAITLVVRARHLLNLDWAGPQRRAYAHLAVSTAPDPLHPYALVKDENGVDVFIDTVVYERSLAIAELEKLLTTLRDYRH